MSDNLSYKCPACGAGIGFDPEAQAFVCEYCTSRYTQEELDKIHLERAAREELKSEHRQEQDTATAADIAEEQEHMAEYVCNSCGAHVVTDDTTAATFCYYCHNPVVITDRLSGAFLPDLVLPFRIGRETAEDKFREWTGKHRYVPKDFGSPEHLEKMTGLYLPYWLNDANSTVDFLADSKKIRTWRTGDYIHTETSIYRHARKGEIFFDDLPAIAFSKFDPDLLRAVTPFQMADAEVFSPSYLSGFFAEQYDMDKDEVTPILEHAAEVYSNTIIYEGLKSAGVVTETHKMIRPTLGDWQLVLLPTWVLTYRYGDRTYVYAVNGQTGRAYGELPMEKKKLSLHAALAGLAAFVLVVILLFFFA